MSVTTTDTIKIQPTDSGESRDERVFGLIALIVIGLFAGATAAFGPVGLAMAALSMVPVIWVTLLLITVGK